MNEPVWTKQIDLEGPFQELGFLRFEIPSPLQNRGVVDEDVECAPSLLHGSSNRFRRARLTYVHSQRRELANRRELSCGFGESVRAAREAKDPRAPLQERARTNQSDSPRDARYYDASTKRLEHAVSYPGQLPRLPREALVEPQGGGS